MTDGAVAAIRSFNRFYTRRIGVLGEVHLNSGFSLTEGRVLYELAHRDGATATELARDLGLDTGYLSRILLKFRKRGYVAAKPSQADQRRSHLALTSKGRNAFAPLERGASNAVADILSPLSHHQQERLVAAMRTIEQLLGAPRESPTPYLLRPHQSGDIGWVVHRHGVLYAKEHGYGELFEALVAEIAAKFIQNFDARRERCWIAEKDGEIVGSVFLVKQSAKVAKLRLLLVEPAARGLGIGKRLVDECIRFARQAGYRTITLWTQDTLHAAQHIYETAGFRLVREEPHQHFGIPMVGQIWEMAL
jgi:DNA-binding MarR family transcriptional regulator/N-acetylglutamate synthase-like GNAT family acetyltransferase